MTTRGRPAKILPVTTIVPRQLERWGAHVHTTQACLPQFVTAEVRLVLLSTAAAATATAAAAVPQWYELGQPTQKFTKPSRRAAA